MRLEAPLEGVLSDKVRIDARKCDLRRLTYLFRGPLGPRRPTGRKKEHWSPRFEHLRQGRLAGLSLTDGIISVDEMPRDSGSWQRTFLARHVSHA